MSRGLAGFAAIVLMILLRLYDRQRDSAPRRDRMRRREADDVWPKHFVRGGRHYFVEKDGRVRSGRLTRDGRGLVDYEW